MIASFLNDGFLGNLIKRTSFGLFLEARIKLSFGLRRNVFRVMQSSDFQSQPKKGNRSDQARSYIEIFPLIGCSIFPTNQNA